MEEPRLGIAGLGMIKYLTFRSISDRRAKAIRYSRVG